MQAPKLRQPFRFPFSSLSLLLLVTLLSLIITYCLPAHVRAATITVTSTTDSGAGSLRQAIADAVPDDTIDFALTSPATIALTSGELLIDKNLTMAGPGVGALTISGNDASRVFNIAAGATVVIRDLSITHGLARGNPAQGGGIYNAGALTLHQVILKDNQAVGQDSTYDEDEGSWSNAGSAEGGAIYNSGELTMVGCAIHGNSAVGGICPETVTLPMPLEAVSTVAGERS